MFPNLQYFESLKEKINLRLNELAKRNRISSENVESQIVDYPWLYGALDKVPAEVSFICENPSLSGVKNAHIYTIDGGSPDIEAQWWGGKARLFRVALYQMNLKNTRPNERGGWECFITNVVKQINIAKDQEALSLVERRQQAIDWAEVLQWELAHVKPKYIFCVGGKAFSAIQWLRQKEYLMVDAPVYKIMHYSARYK